MSIAKSKLTTFGLGIAFVMLNSCGHMEQPLLEHEKCKEDGANLYVKCLDGREKVVPLGFGNFNLVKNGAVPDAAAFCNEPAERVNVMVRNANYILKVENMSDVQVSVPGNAESCKQTRDYSTLRALKRAKIKAAPTTEPLTL